jgi:hypothetical protein
MLVIDLRFRNCRASAPLAVPSSVAAVYDRRIPGSLMIMIMSAGDQLVIVLVLVIDRIAASEFLSPL